MREHQRTSRDPGLQPERTGLAWSRTAFVMFLIALLSLRTSLATGSTTSLIESMLTGTMSLGMLIRSCSRMRYRHDVEDVADKHSRRLLFAIAGIVVVVAVLEIYRLLSRRTMYGF